MTTYYCTKNPKCPAKTLNTTPVDVPTCCNTPMATNKNNTACCNNTNTTVAANTNTKTNTNTAPKKNCCCS